MSAWTVLLLVALAAGLGWALARARFAERAPAERERNERERADVEESLQPVTPSVQKPAPVPPRPPPPKPKPEAIVVGSASAPIAVVTLANTARPARTESVELPSAARHALAPLVEQAPRVLAAAGSLSDGVRVIVKFSPEVARGVATGSLELARASGGEGVRAIAREVSSKRFVEHGRLLTEVNPVAVAGAVWQVAALVTAQRFLADIDVRLRVIEGGLHSLREFLEDERRAKLDAGGRRLRDMAEALRAGRLSSRDLDTRDLDTYAVTLESIDHDADVITQQMNRQLEADRHQLASQDWDRWGSTDDCVRDARATLRQASGHSATLVTSLEVRSLAAAMRGAFALNASMAESSLKRVWEDGERHERLVTALHQTLAAKLPSLKATFQFEETDAKHRSVVGEVFSVEFRPLAEAHKAVLDGVASLVAQLRESERAREMPNELELELARDGSIVSAARRLPAAT